MRNDFQTRKRLSQSRSRRSVPKKDEWVVIPPDMDCSEVSINKPDFNAFLDSPEIALLLATASPCHSHGIVKEVVQQHPQISWEKFNRIATEQGLLLLAEPQLRQVSPPPPLQKILQQARKIYFATLRKNLFLDNLTVQITMALTSAGLPTLLFKGTPFVRQFYGDLGVQAVFGVDVLVRRDHVGLSEEILKSMGFHGPESPGVSPLQSHHVMERNIAGAPVRVTVHWDFQSVLAERLDMEEVWRAAIPYTQTAARDLRWREWDQRLLRPQVFSPSPETQFLYHLLELAAGRYAQGIGLANLCQTALVYESSLNWGQLAVLIEKAGLQKVVGKGLLGASAWGLRIPEEFTRQISHAKSSAVLNWTFNHSLNLKRSGFFQPFERRIQLHQVLTEEGRWGAVKWFARTLFAPRWRPARTEMS